jgi:hypothetical protein
MEKQEKETIYRYCADKSEPISIYTCDEALAARLMKLGLVPARIEKLDGCEISWQFYAPHNGWIVPKIRPKRKMSAEQAQVKAAQLQAGQARQITAKSQPEAKPEARP